MRRREVILDATLDLAIEKGLDAVSVVQILRRAKVGAGTLYNYFPHRRTLIAAVYDQAAYILERDAMRGYRAAGIFRERFTRYLCGLAHAAREHPRELAFLRTYRSSASIDVETRASEWLYQTAEEGLFSEGSESGALSELPPDVAREFVKRALLAVVQGAADGRYQIGEEDIERVVGVCWRALAASPAPTAGTRARSADRRPCRSCGRSWGSTGRQAPR